MSICPSVRLSLSICFSLCPSVCPCISALFSLDGFPRNLILGVVMQICWETENFGENAAQISGTLHDVLSMLRCCRHTKFAAKALLCNTQHFYAVASDCTSTMHTERIVALQLQRDTILRYTYSACLVNLMMIYLLAAIGLTPGGGSTVHIYTQTIHRTTQSTENNI
jgi:hypothetical protein